MSNQKGPTEGGSGGKRGHSNMEHWTHTEEVKESARVHRRLADSRESSLGLAEHEGARLLRRFWFRVTQGYGYGVTAYSEQEAEALARQAAAELGLPFEIQEVVADVDIRTLDPGHVLPNMDPPNFHGVWFPQR